MTYVRSLNNNYYQVGLLSKDSIFYAESSFVRKILFEQWNTKGILKKSKTHTALGSVLFKSIIKKPPVDLLPSFL